MRARGINYDTGTFPGDQLTRKAFDPGAVRQEMAVIAGDLHCDAVRVSGRDGERLSVAARHAADAGLEVWFSPFPVDLPPGELLAFLTDCAQRAEAVRQAGAEVQERLNLFLAEATAAVRSRFGGRVTYASGPWEAVDWAPFDLVSVDAYWAAHNAGTFRGHLRDFFSHGKPVAVTEYGTCAYRGAGDLGGMAWQPPAGAVPDEAEQVRYLNELLDIFEVEGVDTALWFCFANYDKPGDRDIASYGVVRMLDQARWEPKEVFHAMAARYK